MALACFVLARCLQLGQAVPPDLDKAVHYFTKVYIYTTHLWMDGDCMECLFVDYLDLFLSLFLLL